MARPTARSSREFAFLLILIAAATGCRPEPAEQAYRHTWSLYTSGKLPQAASDCSRNAALWTDPRSPWFWKFHLLKAEILTAQGKAADAGALLKDPAPPNPELGQLEVRRLIDQAILKANRPNEANPLLERARGAVQDPELSIRIRIAEGFIAWNQRQFQAAHTAFGAAADLAARQGMLYWQAQALGNQSAATKNMGLYEESLRIGLQALTLAERIGAHRVAAATHGNLGPVYSYLGDAETALEHEKKAVQELETIGDRYNFMVTLGELGLMYDRQDDSEHAIGCYRQAFQLACDLTRDRDAERIAGNLALSLIKSRQWDAAAEWNQKALDLAPRIEHDDDIPYLTRNRAQIAYGRGDTEEAMRICEELLRGEKKDMSFRWSVYALMATADARARRFPKANREFAAALKIIDENRAELADSRFRMTLLSRLIPFYRNYVDALVAQKNDAAAIRIAESSRARVLTELMQRDQRPQPFPGLTSLQEVARSTDSALLSFWLAPVRSYAWLITPSQVRRFDLPPEGEIEKLVTAYREVVEHALTDPILVNHPSGPNLWNALMREIGPAIPKDSRLIVIPDGALHRLNLETLVVPSPLPHYWIEDVEIGVAPSITIAASRPQPQAARDRSLLLIGAPDYTGSGFEPLKNVGKEVSDIEARFPIASRKVLTGAKAAPAAYRESNPGGYSHIHFAAHADANFQNPLGSAVILSGQGSQNRLYARDVIDIPIHADLVTISACRSAGVRSYAGEGLIGFAWAFLRAGAGSVVAGLWDVSDSSTEPLMERFYAGIAGGQNPVRALHRAKLALRKDDPRFTKPFYWGPFQTYVASAAK